MPVAVILVYAAVSLVLGGIAATYEIWHAPSMLDRANGRGNFPTPRVGAIGICLCVVVFWPLLIALTIAAAWRERR